MSITNGIKSIIQSQRKTVDTAIVRGIDGERVDITIGSSPNMIRHVEVIGGVDSLVPGSEVPIIWNEGRPIVLSGFTSTGINLSVTTTNRIDTPGTLSVFTNNEPLGAHTHRIDASSAPGPAAKILRTNSIGGVELEYLNAEKIGINTNPTSLLDINSGDLNGIIARIVAAHGYQVYGEIKNALADFKLGIDNSGQFVISDVGSNRTPLVIEKQTAISSAVTVKADGVLSLAKDNLLLNNKRLGVADDVLIDPSGALVGSSLVFNGSQWVPGSVVSGVEFEPADGLSRRTVLYGELYTIPAGYEMLTSELELVGDMDMKGDITILHGGTVVTGDVQVNNQNTNLITADIEDGLSIVDDVIHLSPFVGDTGNGGKSGAVPAPEAGDANKVLYGDGSWRDLPAVDAIGQSDSMLLIETGSKTFTVPMGMAWTVGSRLRAASRANPNNYMDGNVTFYNGNVLTMNVTNVGGSGSYDDWNLTIVGAIGVTGEKGDKGAQWRGEYSPSTSYVVDDIVSYQGSGYICIQASTGNVPTNTAYFSPLAVKGDPGDPTFFVASPAVNQTVSGEEIELTAASALVFGDVVRIDSSGKMAIAKANAIANADGMFMCSQSSIGANSSGKFLIRGVVRNDSWNWTPGGRIYLSTTGTNGNTMTQTAPTATNSVIQYLGHALTAKTIFFKPEQVQVVHA